MTNAIAAVIIVVVLVVAAAGGYFAGTSGKVTSTVTSTSVSTVTSTGSGGPGTTVTTTMSSTVTMGNSSSGNITQAFAPSAALVAQAQSEGTLSVYGPIPQSIFTQFYWSTFTQLYPWAKLNYFSSDPASIYAKTLSEYQANKVGSDIIINNFNYFVLSKANNITAPDLLSVVPQYYPSVAYDPQGYWYAYGSIPVIVMYNTNLVSASQVPKSYFDLTNSTWKGKIGLDLPSNLNALGGTLCTLSTILGPTEWTDYVSALATNQPKYYPDSGGVFQAVSSGDVSIGLGYLMDVLQNSNSSVKAAFLQPTIWQPASIAVSNNAPDPAMAQLFLLWFLSPGGATINGFAGFVSTSPYFTTATTGVIPANVTLLRMYSDVTPDPNFNPTYWTNLITSTMNYTG
jgi:ABC-type Fe3+ transport system substrate-binding protein